MTNEQPDAVWKIKLANGNVDTLICPSSVKPIFTATNVLIFKDFDGEILDAYNPLEWRSMSLEGYKAEENADQ